MVKTFQTTLWCWYNVSLGNSLMTSRFVQKANGFTPWDYLSEEIPSRGTTLRLTGYPEELWSMFFFSSPQEELGIFSTLSFTSSSLNFMSGDPNSFRK